MIRSSLTRAVSSPAGRRRRTAGLAATALAAVLAMTLSGCETRQSGAAAVVGDRRISVAAVQSAYADVLPLVSQDAQLNQATILNLLILEPYLTEAASAIGRGVSATDAQLDVKAAAEGRDLRFSPAGLEVWRANLANQALQGSRTESEVRSTYEAITARVKADGVHINPRFGAGLDLTNLSITPEQPNWLTTSASGRPAVPAPGNAPQQEAPPQETVPPTPEGSPAEGSPGAEESPAP